MEQLRSFSCCGGERDVCSPCYMKEEQKFQYMYQFFMKRKNWQAIIEATDMKEKLVIKCLKDNRL